jgi:plastocyanin
MDNETLFYVCGGILAVSAIVVTFLGLKSEKFPGRALPLVVVWFAVFVIGATTFAVRYSAEEAEHKAHELELANEKIEAAEGDSGDPADVGSEESAPEEGSQEEEPVGEVEGGSEGSEGSEGGAGAETTLQLAADETALAFDKTELDAKAGKVTIDFDNPSPIPHNVVIEENGEELAGFEPITEGKEELTADLKAGTYAFICSVPGHAEAGMEGTLKVQ